MKYVDSGGNIWNSSGTIMSPHYPSLYKKAISSRWKITAKETDVIEIKIEELVFGDEEDSSCERTTLIIKETSSGQIIEKLCKLSEPKIVVSKTNSVTILFETSGEKNGIKYKLKFKMSKIYIDLLLHSI